MRTILFLPTILKINPSKKGVKILPSTSPEKQSSFRHWILKLHLWLGFGAAIFWLLQALTGILLSFHFEIEDARLSMDHHPTDFTAIEQRINQLGEGTSGARVNWIWTTAGLADRYMINHTGKDGDIRIALIHGNGEIVIDHKADDRSFFGFVRDLHLELLSGRGGEIFLGICGFLLITNLIFGGITAWPRRGPRSQTLEPANTVGPIARLYSWHHAVGRWIIIPALIVITTGTLIEFEHDIEHLIGVAPPSVPAITPTGPGIGFAKAANTAVQAIPGSQFVGTVFPSEQNASYQFWLRAPGELFRSYGGSLVVVDANDGAVRGAFPASEGNARQKFILYLYTLHTGEVIGIVGRILSILVGLWLMATILFGVGLRPKHKEL